MSTPLETILSDDPTLEAIVEATDKYELQIRYTQIRRDSANFPHFKTYDFQVDSSVYFYPASTVKLPIALLALERINLVRKSRNYASLSKYTPLVIDSIRPPQTAVTTDSTAENGLPSVAHYVKKIFAVSDNDAYNRLFEFLGRASINRRLHKKGLKDTRILHRLGAQGYDNRYTNPILFYDQDTLIYQQVEQFDPTNYNLGLIPKGVGYVDMDGKKVHRPFDFGQKNAYSIADMESTLKAVFFPETLTRTQRFELTADDYRFLYKNMSRLPREHDYPSYNSSKYYDSYVKFFLFGDKEEAIPSHLKIFNKVGYAYGYLSDCAYIIDTKNQVEFLLSATIHVNANQFYNDDTYEYDAIGIPFLANLGRAIYEYELQRERKYSPDLSKYIIE